MDVQLEGWVLRGILGKFNLGKRNFGNLGLWKFHRKLAVILAVVLACQSIPIRAEQSGQIFANAGDTEGETAQGEGGTGTETDDGKGDADGSEGGTSGSGDGSEGDTSGSGDGNEGDTSGSEGDTSGDGSEGDTSGSGDGNEGDTSGSGDGNEGDTSGSGGGSEGDTSGSETLELEFEFPEPDAQAYTKGIFKNTVHSKDGTALSGVTIQYKIDNTDIASIDSDTGEVTFLKAGTVNITAEAVKQTLAGEGTTEGEPGGGGTTDGESSGSGTTDGESSEGGITGGESSGSGTTDGESGGSGTTGGEFSGSGTTGGEFSGSGTTGGESGGDGTTGGEPGGSGMTGEEPSGSGTTGGESGGSGMTGEEPSGSGTTGGEFSGSGTTSGGGESSGGEPASGEAAESKLLSGESSGEEITKGESTGGEITEGDSVDGTTEEGEKTEGTTTEDGTIKDTTGDKEEVIVASISYTLVIEKAVQTIAFDKKEQTFSVLYGQAFSNSAIEGENTNAYDGRGYGSGKITYKMVSGSDIASVDDGGNLTFQDGKTGTVTVEAVKEEDDCYLPSTPIQYTVNVAYEQTPAMPYTLSGNQNTGFEDWYCGEVIICPPNGYLINDNNNLADTGWKSSMVQDEEGICANKVIYLKNENTGGITDAIPVEKIRIDKTAPSDLTISYDEPIMEKVKEVLSFGFYKAELEITLKAQDDVSGVSSFTYWLNGAGQGTEADSDSNPDSGTAVDPDNGVVVKAQKGEDGIYYATFMIQPQFKGNVIFTATDGAGNRAENQASNGIVIDNKPPKLSVVYDGEYKRASYADKPGISLAGYKEGNDTNINLYYGGSGLTLDFTIEEENFYEEDVVVKVNGEAPAECLVWTQNGAGKYEASLELKDEGAYVVAISYQDRSQSGKAEYTSEHIIIDSIKPELEVDYCGKEYVKAKKANAPGEWLDNYTLQTRTDVNLYYAEPLVLNFTIKEQNFYAEDAVVIVNGEKRTLEWAVREEEGQKYAAADLELIEDGEYVVTLGYDDPSHNGIAEYTSEHIIIDKTAPVLAVKYGSSYVKASSENTPGVPLPDYVEHSKETVNLYYDNSAAFDFTITEQNFFAEYVQVKVNEEERTLTWTQKADGSREYTAHLELAVEGAYVVTLCYQDPSGHAATQYTSEHIILDKTDPEIQVTYNEVRPVAGTQDIYNQRRTATIIIRDQNIYPNDGDAVSIKITAKDALGADVDMMREYSFTRVPKEAGDDSDAWMAVVPFEQSANYMFEFTVEDMAGHKVSYGQDSFTVDVTKPDAGKFSISYSEDYQNWFEQLLHTVSFGYYRPSVTITFTAQDETTSIVGMNWTYTRRNEESNGEPETKTGTIGEGQLKRAGNQAIGQITLTADEASQYRGNISFQAIDKAGNESDCRTDTGTVIVVDTITPTRTARYSPAKQVTEKKSGSTMKDYSGENTIAAENSNGTGNFNGIGNLNGTGNSNGIGNLNGTGNSKEIDNIIEGIGAVLYYDDVMSLTLEVVEANFYAEDVKVYVYRDGRLLADGDGYHYEAGSNWVISERDRNAHKMTLQLGTENTDSSKDGDYVVVISYSDRSGNEMPVYTSEQITIDTRKPVLNIAYPENAVIRDGIVYLNENPFLEVLVSEHNFRAAEVSVTVTAKDAYGNEIPVTAGKDANGEDVTFAQYLSDAANWTSVGDEHRATVLLAEDAGYEFVVSYYDLAMQAAEEPAGCVIMVDRKASTWEDIPYDKAYGGNFARMVDSLNQQIKHAEEANQDTRFIFQGEMTLSIGLIEENFFPKDVEIAVERDGVLLEPGTGYHYDPQAWTVDSEDSTHHTLELVLGEGNTNHSADGDYRVKLSYTDTSGNVSKQYVSNVLTIDTTAPTVSVEYDNNEPHMGAFYGSSRTAVITVTDRNIRTDEIDIRIFGTDIWGNALENVSAKIGSWVPGEEEGSWKNTITYDMDANYDIQILCPDMAGNQSLFTDGFTIDKGLPGLRYEYSNSLMETALNFITFGYYQPDVTVTVYVQDDISGVDYLTWGYEKEAGSSAVNVETRGGTIDRSGFTFETTEYGVEARASIRLTANEAEQYRGRIHFETADRAGNIKRETDGGRIIVLDTISPTRTVSYSPAVQVADRQTGTVLTDDTYEEGADIILYYDGPMEVAFQINEANFYAEDVICKVNDEVVQISDWSNDGDHWSGSLSLYEDGDYFITMEYTDRSGNGMTTYTSSQITIDTIAPQIETNWTAENVIQAKENINYSQEDMSVTIVIHERNFRAQDVEAVVTAVDAAGVDVPVDDYAGYLKDAQSWITDGNMHTAVLNFPADANYTFTIQFRDMVFHPSEEYEPYAFTVDKTPPRDITIDYSTPILESILNAVTFGFYNAHTTVTITAVDDTSGVDHFIYSFLRAEDVSNVNTELINAQIEESDIVYSEGRKTATATFRIPNSELGENTQFNGTVETAAIDRTQLETKFVDGKRIVVDTIAPVAEVQYNEPVSMDGDISYYDGTIEGVINVTEANFYAEDVNLYVSKDGGAFEALTPAWTQLGMDRNAGAFTLTGDGEYIVSAVYTDRSTNQMVEYQSDLLVIDTVEPQITVSGIGNYSANRDETIGFVVTVRDENLDPGSCHPKLMAEVCDDVSGGTMFRELDMADAGVTNTVHNGGEYVYTYVVENLDRDGIYTLSCEAADRAGHSVTEVTVESTQNGRTGQNGEQSTEQVMFSVNRNGSTYHLDQDSRNIIGTFAKAPIDIVVTEINPDILNVIQITLFRDEKTLLLQEGKDYRVDRTGGDGEWNSYVYTIFSENFENDGIYRISIYSEDEAENVAENTLDNKNLEISFGIDKTLPNLIVTNLESGRTYNEDSHTVNMQAEDNMRLVSVEVWLDGEAYMSWGEDEILRKTMEYEDYSFVISGESTRAHDVTVALTDAAGNRLVKEINDFYVTTNFWLIFWRQILENKPLLFGTMAGVTGVVATPAGILKLRRRRIIKGKTK